ncbi:MAG: hypothetical protein SGI84_06955 [Gemmatimonadota bacterium]|nr:hypothetical protein [Gemmatimonadota bacterium]
MAVALLCAGLPALRAEAQLTPRSAAVIGGIESRSYQFAAPLPIRRITQVAIPVGAVATFGRLSLDLGTYWAATSLTRQDNRFRRVTGFTDTQARVAWTFGRDLGVASLVLNLPTGLDRMSPADFDVLGTVSSPFLGFPVNAYANGGSVTAAVAMAAAAGAWNLGAAGSLRANRTFTPVVDPVAGPLNYRAGVEGRLRLGADRLVGQSRVALGVTLSGFGDDIYAGLGVARGAYQPGLRWILEGMVTAPAGNGVMTGTVWSYQRNAGDTAGVSLGNHENLFGLTATAAWPLLRGVSMEPGVEVKYSGLKGGSGLLGGGGVGLRGRFSDRISGWSGVRYDGGYLDAQSLDDQGQAIVNRTRLNSWYLSVFVRTTW